MLPDLSEITMLLTVSGSARQHLCGLMTLDVDAAPSHQDQKRPSLVASSLGINLHRAGRTRQLLCDSWFDQRSCQQKAGVSRSRCCSLLFLGRNVCPCWSTSKNSWRWTSCATTGPCLVCHLRPANHPRVSRAFVLETSRPASHSSSSESMKTLESTLKPDLPRCALDSDDPPQCTREGSRCTHNPR